MDKKYAYGIGFALVCMFALGRYTVAKKVEVKEVEKIVYVDKIVIDKALKTKKSTTSTKAVDGSETTTTTEETVEDTHTVDNTETTKDKEYSKTVTPLNLGLRLDLLAGLDVTNPASGYLVGAHISKPVLGPITIGLWLLTNKTAGVSAGLQF